MQHRQQFTPDRELEREILALPRFAGGNLQFEGQLSANHSQLLEYTFQSDSGTKSLVVKQQTPSCQSEQVTLQEFTNLGRVRSLMGFDLAQSVPEPLLVLPERGILVTRKVGGIPLTRILKKYANLLAGPFCARILGEAGLSAGAWLRNFQQATSAEPVTFNMNSYLADLELRLVMFQEKGIESGQDILRLAARYCALLNGRLIPAAARHGDFIAQNILIHDKGVGIVDFEGFGERAAIYDDAGMFIGYLLVLGARGSYSRRALDAVRRGFLAGFVADDPLDQVLLNTYTIRGAVRIIADGPAFSSNWRQFGAARRLARRLEQLASGTISL
jgi:Phosphotransferase enzyme family